MLVAFVEGWRRVWRAPGLAVSITLALVVVSAPLAMRPGDLVSGGGAATIRSAVAIVNNAWIGDRAASSGSTTGAALHAVLGIGGTLAMAFLLFWVFLAGGILDRLARGRPVGTAQFFAACGGYLFRFARLGLIIGAAYAVLFRLRGPISSRGGFLAFLSAVALVSLVADFAKVRMVVEDRRSALGALLAALRFIWQRPVQTVVLYALNIFAAVGLVLLWEWLNPVAFMINAPIWAAFLVGLPYLFVRVIARLALMASEVVYFQRALAHAGYTAAPEIVWPDSPAVEAIQNLTSRKGPTPEGRERYEGREGSAW